MTETKAVSSLGRKVKVQHNLILLELCSKSVGIWYITYTLQCIQLQIIPQLQ